MLRKTTVTLMVFVFIAAWISYSAVEAGEQNLHGRIIILDPGHGEENPNTYEGYFEHIAMLALAKKIKPVLEARGATVYMTRQTDNDVDLPVRTAMINRWALLEAFAARQRELPRLIDEQAISQIRKEMLELNRLLRIVESIIDDFEKNARVYMNHPFDYTYRRQIHPDWQRVFEYQSDAGIWSRFLVISLHSNATPKPRDTSEQGADAFYIANDIKENMRYYTNYTNEWLNAYFAEQILNNLEAAGVKKREASSYYYHILREHNLPCVLVENGFHTNDLDRARLSDDAFLDELAMIYADTIWDYFIWLGPLTESNWGRFDGAFGRQ